MDTTNPVEDEPKSDAWYEAEVDRMLLQLKQMQEQRDPAEEQRRSEAHRAEFDAAMAETNKILDAIAADIPRKCKRCRKVSSLRSDAAARNATHDHSLSGSIGDV